MDADGKTVHFATNIDQPEPFDFHTPIAEALGAPVILENNVNLAALGERWRGVGRDLRTFVIVAVGAGIGAGLIHDGRLLRGTQRLRRGRVPPGDPPATIAPSTRGRTTQPEDSAC